MNPEQNIQGELSLEESVRQVMQTLPLPIQHYLGQLKHFAFVQRTVQKYGLHVDQGGVLERELMLLLMGIKSPEEFQNVLASDAAIPDGIVSALLADINQEIFIPLRNEMQHPASAQAPKPVPPMRSAQPQVTQGTPDYTGRLKIQVPPPSTNPPAPPAQRVVMPVTPPAPRPVQAPQMPQRAPIMNPERELPVGEGHTTTAPLPPKAALPRQNVQPRPVAPAPFPPAQPTPPAMPVSRPVMPEPIAPRPSISPAPTNLPGAFTPPPAPRPLQPPPPAPRNYGSTDPYSEPLE